MKTNDIVLICDDNYCIPTAVCIQSIILNVSKDRELLNIHVCSFGLNKSNKDKLENLSKGNVCVTVDYFNEMDYRERIDLIHQRSHVTPTALIKFELPSFFTNLDSVLYLDGDIIIKDNIEDLLNIDLANKYMAASFEFWTYMNAVKYTFMREVPFYFNSGVMLLNLRKMRMDKITEQLWDYKLNHAKTTLMDQESLNAVCGHNTLPLSVVWNFNPIFLEKKYIRYINRVYGEQFEDEKHLLKCVKIIHYVGKGDKPWVFKNARLRQFWDMSNRSLEKPEVIQMKEHQSVKRSFCTVIVDKIKNHGMIGTGLYLLYLLRTRLSM